MIPYVSLLLCISIASVITIFGFDKAFSAKYNQIRNIRYWVAPDHVRIVLDLKEYPKFQYSKHKGKSPYIQLIVKDVISTKIKKCTINNDTVKNVVVSKLSRNKYAIYIKLHKALKSHIFALKRFRQKPDRIVVDIFKQDSKKIKTERVERIKSLGQKGYRIVVIDPGHGGEDPGAIGFRKLREKDIVLQISREIKNCLNRQRGYVGVMTRTTDYFLSLNQRRIFAEQCDADLFVSIHTNASHKKWVKGASFYCLSVHGASNKAAELLANKENASDLIGGIEFGKDSILDSILIDLAQNYTINQSIACAHDLLKYFRNNCRLEPHPVRRAGFAVLKSPKVPSVLVEVGYITNAREAKKLANRAYQQKLARLIVDAIKLYFKDIPQPIPLQEHKAIKAKKNQGGKLYVVKKGDTLWRIAKNYNVDINTIRKVNNLKNLSRIAVGQKLVIPQ